MNAQFVSEKNSFKIILLIFSFYLQASSFSSLAGCPSIRSIEVAVKDTCVGVQRGLLEEKNYLMLLGPGALSSRLLFYEDLFEGLRKYEEIESLNVCDNLTDHMVGYVYVQFREEEHAANASKILMEDFMLDDLSLLISLPLPIFVKPPVGSMRRTPTIMLDTATLCI